MSDTIPELNPAEPPERPSIVESDGPIVRILCGSFELIGRFERVSEETRLSGVHAGGLTPNAVGIRGLRAMAGMFLEDQNAQRLVVSGAVRRTGTCPGRLPKSMTFLRSGR